MTWYNPKTWFVEKLNPAQEAISHEQGSNISTDAHISYAIAFNKLETVNRGVNMIVSGCASLDFDVKDKIMDSIPDVVIRQKSLYNLLNNRPNLFQSALDFRNSIFTDFLLEGNIFIYFDGAFLYHLPAANVVIETDPTTFVSGYSYMGVATKFKPNEIIHIRDIDITSVYRGSSRLASAERNINILYKMQAFQEQFFDNGAFPGLIFSTENTLSPMAKEKTYAGWSARYSPKNGARRPIILDSGLVPHNLSNQSFQEMDFESSVSTHDVKILKALGVPPILLDGGNNANISPNLRLFYLETVMPIIYRYVSAMERYFGYDIAAVTENVSALQPDMKEAAEYYSTLTNGGIMTPNESRVALRLPKDLDPESNKLRIPANITGSAANPSLGGAPKKPASTN